MDTFSNQLRKDVDPIWQRILFHPYLVEISNATLPIEKFMFYIKQDYSFLIQYARCLGIATAKVQDLETMRTFASLLNSSLTLEMRMLERLGLSLRISIEELKRAEPTPTNLAYNHYMLYVSYSGTVGEAMATMLPCMWSYQEIGERLDKSEKIKEHPIYSEWSSTYSSSEYIDLVKWYKTLVNELATQAGQAERKRMKSHFTISSKYEYMFWNMVYKQEQWPI